MSACLNAILLCIRRVSPTNTVYQFSVSGSDVILHFIRMRFVTGVVQKVDCQLYFKTLEVNWTISSLENKIKVFFLAWVI